MMLAGLYRYYDNEEEKGIVSYGREVLGSDGIQHRNDRYRLV